MKVEEAKRLILEGRELGVALSIDTCVFEREAFRFEQGRLKHMEQFGKLPGAVVISDVVHREVLAHLAEKADASRGAFLKALADFADYWQVSEADRKSVKSSMVSKQPPPDLAKERFNKFLEKCGAALVAAEGNASIEGVLARYFAMEPPFEARKDKKHEFPDAFALLSLEAWAAREKKPIVLVSTDGGWKEFASKSEHLCCVDSLDDAISMFQARDRTRMDMAQAVARRVEEGTLEVVDVVEHCINSFYGWEVDAYSYLPFETEEEVIVEGIERRADSWLESMQVIDYIDGSLTLAIRFIATVEADVNFGFSMDGVNLGDARVSKKLRVPFKALVTIADAGSDEPFVEDVEMLDSSLTLRIGHVDPDFSDEHDEEQEREAD